MSEDVPTPIDLLNPAEARAWEANTIAKRPYRKDFFAAFAAALAQEFAGPFCVLELGSGPGHLAQAILGSMEGAAYVALDFSPAMHDLARQRLGLLAARVEFVTADFREAAWLGRRFDAVVTLQAVHEVRHVRHVPALFARVRDVLEPGGLFLYADHYCGPGWNPDLMLAPEAQPELLSQAGFGDCRKLLDLGGMALWAGRRF